MDEKKKIVLVSGAFDIIHAGHIAYLEKAKSYGDTLIVSLTTDRFINKGPGRPVFPTEVRAKVLESLKVVDQVIISDNRTTVDVIKTVQPDFYIKGKDYADLDTPDLRAEIEAVESVGGKFVCTDDELFSSSKLANQFFVSWTEEQQEIIAKVKDLGGMEAIESALTKIKEQVRVAVVGECISDVYRFVKADGISSKSPTISVRFLDEETYEGGATAIVKHMSDFADVVQIKSGIVHKKIRYIAKDSGQRLFEVVDLGSEQRLDERQGFPAHNLLLVADFGHGLIHNTFSTGAFKALNVQTNSSNYGFNSFKRHRQFDYLVIDQRELRLAYQDKTTSAVDLGAWAHAEHKKPIAVTLGPEGSVFFKDGISYKCPAFCDKVVDAIGAGDAFLSITSLLVRTEAHPVLIGFLGNVFAGLKAKIIGNKSSVTKDALIRTCSSILK